MNFDELWHGHEFDLPKGTEGGDAGEEAEPTYCVYARKFNLWAEELCAGAVKDPNTRSLVVINQAKVLLLDKYMEWRSFVPKKHRAYTGSYHVCIFHIFVTAYDRLKVVELSLTPPMLFLPAPPPPLAPPPAPPPPPQIAGVFIGEIDE